MGQGEVFFSSGGLPGWAGHWGFVGSAEAYRGYGVGLWGQPEDVGSMRSVSMARGRGLRGLPE